MKKDIDEAFGIDKIIALENKVADLKRQRQVLENEI